MNSAGVPDADPLFNIWLTRQQENFDGRPSLPFLSERLGSKPDLHLTILLVLRAARRKYIVVEHNDR